jgi:hypothetical protein
MQGLEDVVVESAIGTAVETSVIAVFCVLTTGKEQVAAGADEAAPGSSQADAAGRPNKYR